MNFHDIQDIMNFWTKDETWVGSAVKARSNSLKEYIIIAAMFASYLLWFK